MKIRRVSVWAMSFLFVISLCSCVIQEKREEHLVWEKLADDWGAAGSYRYEGKAPRIIVISDHASISSLQNQLRPSHFELVAEIDFSAYLVIVIYQGEKGSTGYSVEVTDIQQKDNAIAVYAKFHEPAPNASSNPLVTSPYYVLKVKKTEGLKGEFTFVLLANGKEVARQVQTIP